MNCPVCNQVVINIKYRLNDYNISRCSGCGLLYNSDFPPAGSNEKAFSAEYYCRVQSNAFKYSGESYLRDPSVKVFQNWLDFIERRLKKGQLLDVGCGLGNFLAVAKKRGWKPFGLDISEYAVAQVRQELGVEAFAGSLLNAPWPAESFDLITFWDSIEHVANPRDYLTRARDLLKPQGRVIISTDNADCLIGDLANISYRISGGRMKYAMERFFISHNATYFTDKQFRLLVEELGFELLEFQKIEYPLDKINANLFERVILGTFYLLAKIFHRQTQFVMLLRKK